LLELVETLSPNLSHRDCVSNDRAKELLHQGENKFPETPGCLRVVFIKPLQPPKDCLKHYYGKFLPLGISAQDFEAISKMVKLPRLYLPLLCSATAASHLIADPATEGVILQSKPAWNYHFSLAITQETATKNFYILIIGLDKKEIKSLLDAMEKEKLHSLGELAAAIPLYLLEQRAAETQLGISTCYKRMRELEDRIGIYNKNVYSKPSQQTSADTDFRDVAKIMTSVSIEAAKSEYNSEVYLRMLDILETAAFVGSRRRTCQEASLEYGNEYTTMKIASLRSAFQSIASESRFYAKRAQSYRETLYSLIAHKDNSQMLFMSIITFILLPVTSTATFFSTSFFNFQASPGERVVSQRLWIYFVVYFIISIPIILPWSWSMRRAKSQRGR
jgi:hypothetical protein